MKVNDYVFVIISSNIRAGKWLRKTQILRFLKPKNLKSPKFRFFRFFKYFFGESLYKSYLISDFNRDL